MFGGNTTQRRINILKVTELLRSVIPLLTVALAVGGGCGKMARERPEMARAEAGMRSVTLSPLATEPTTQRWRDAGDVSYVHSFRDESFYSGPGRSARIEWLPSSLTLTGRVTLEGLKPNFAYQVKLIGGVPSGKADPADLVPGSAEWTSAVLGQSGRWCSGAARANVLPDQAAKMLRRGEPLTGYLLFDFVITDAEGHAAEGISLDSSYHVLWRSDQRDRNRRDSPMRHHTIARTAYGYGPGAPEAPAAISLFAEREVPRPGHGQVRLPPGDYRALINLTEESFHANQKEPLEGGGFWAQVLEAPIEFRIEP